ncbi:MAG: betaine-aldehyde dehydrogenase [Zetaproteobacteria bacterium]|nr:betaine-aldehyde dehydrogenase [Pseudobdellovibrionaceae bacterium]
MQQHLSINDEVRKFLSQDKLLLIDGQWQESRSEKTINVENPANGDTLSQLIHGGQEDINRAVEAARKAFDSGPWRSMTGSERSRRLWKLADLIEQNTDTFAQLESLDNGKPYTVAKAADVPLSVDIFRYMAGWSTKIHGKTIPLSVPYTPDSSYLSYTLKEPVGVIGQIIPWNFPLLMAAWKLAPALACGNTVVLKPAEQTSLSALKLGELIMEAGIPEGVVNIVTGHGDTGSFLVDHPMVDKLAFTGSTEVGKQIVRGASGNLKKVSLELGGKSPNIIFADADIEAAIEGAANAIFFNHGQCCCAGSRLYVEKSVYDKVLSGVCDFADKIKLGNGFDLSTQMGPLISREQFDKVCSYIDSGKREGAVVQAGGSGLDQAGYFVKPTVLAKTHKNMQVVREEIFGPVVAAIPFSSEEELIEEANDSNYGLAAGIWSQDVSKAHKVAEKLRAGTVWVNCYNIFDASLPFGGYKESGWGREMGDEVLNLYLETKSVCIKK